MISILLTCPAFAVGEGSGASAAGCEAVDYRLANETVELDKSSGGHSSPPPNSDGPTIVDVSLFVIDVTGVDELAGTFSIEALLDLEWCDPRLAASSETDDADRRIFVSDGAALELDRIWWPDPSIANAVTSRQAEQQTLELSADGTVEYQERFTATVEASYELRRFPFDQQTLKVVIESFAWSSQELLFHDQGGDVGFGDAFEIPEWHTVAVRARIDAEQDPGDRASFSRWVLEIDVSRQAAFYVWKLLLPLVILVMLSWSVFWLDSANLAERLGVSFTGILTVVAYQLLVADYLPKISYLTFMDAVLFTSFALMALTVVENVWANASRTADAEGAERIQGIDKTCRWLFPAVYGGLIAILALIYL